MKIIRPSVEYWGQCPTDYQGNLALIERAGRLCYKSEDKIGPGTAEKFVGKLTTAGHWAMLEHSNLVVRLARGIGMSSSGPGAYLQKHHQEGVTYFGGNLRAWLEGLECDYVQEIYGHFQQNRWGICPHDEIPAALHRYTVKFICDRGVSHELVRHRPCSFAQESTRYCDYKGGDIQFIEPWWWNGEVNDASYNIFADAMHYAEIQYGLMRKAGHSPQAARAVLPNALKTEVVVTADAGQWQIIKSLRLHKAAHPDMQRIMAMVPWDQIEGGGR